MSRILTVAIFALMLADCTTSVPGYDKSAVPNATAALRQATAMCGKEQTALRYTACEVAGQRDFAMAIHLQKMDAFDAYAAQIMALAGDWDAGRVGRKQLAGRAASIRTHYWMACNCDLRGRKISADNSSEILSSVISPPW
jgi:hypothetical protein